MVFERRATGGKSYQRGRSWAHDVCSRELDQRLFQLDEKHPPVVHFTPTVVGSPDPRMVRPGRSDLRRRIRGGGAQACRRETASSRSGVARYLVLVSIVAVFHIGLAGRD